MDCQCNIHLSHAQNILLNTTTWLKIQQKRVVMGLVIPLDTSTNISREMAANFSF